VSGAQGRCATIAAQIRSGGLPRTTATIRNLAASVFFQAGQTKSPLPAAAPPATAVAPFFFRDRHLARSA